MIFRCLLSISIILTLFTAPGHSAEDAGEKGYTLVKDLTKLPVLSPTLKNTNTQKIKLENGLEAYLISDPDADVSGAMLSVKAGSWEDPPEHPGLAHFLEHMLFLGTLRYPNESEYHRFISEHGGQTNAFTASNSTNYLFTVSNSAFDEALDRFASFFKEPLFNPSGVNRELQAIDQEYAKNIEQDSIRQLYVLKELADAQHPFHAFNMGHSESLSTASRETLEEWFTTHYSANLMKLVVYSPQPLEKIARQVSEDFSGIPDRNREAPVIDRPAYQIKGDPQFIYIEPVKDKRTLTIVWELPAKFSHAKETKPEEIVSYVLGHEGEKSLLAQLKREKLAESLASGGSKVGDDLTLMYLQIELTNEGLRDLDQVITRVYQAIRNLRDKGVPSYLFDEIKNMATIEYQYRSKNNEFLTLMQHAYRIQEEDISTYPEHSEIVQQFNPELVRELLGALTPGRAHYLIMAPSRLTGVSKDKKEKWLGVPYGTKPIATELLDKWKHAAPHEEIDIPAPNIFIPDNLTLVYDNFKPSDRLIPEPIKLTDSEKGIYYFSHDDKFGIPKISWTFTILTPHISMEDPRSIVYGDIFVKDLKNSLSKISYPATMAGLDYDITRESNGIRIVVRGYSQNAGRLLDEILSTIKNYKPEMASYKLLKDSQMRKYKNFSKGAPLEQSLELFKSVLYEEFVTEKEKAAALRKASFKRYAEFAGKLFDRTYVESMLYGNMTEDKGRTLVAKFNDTFDQGAYPENEHLEDGVLVLPQDQGPYYLECRTKAQGNAVLLAIEEEDFSFKKRAAQQILMQAVKEPFFSTLRTKQQTGYLVHSFPEEVERKLFNIFAVQSNTHDVRDLLSRFEQFIEGYVQEIGNTELSEQQFENIKMALMIKYSEPAKNIAKMGDLLNTLAFDYDGDFKWIEKRLEAFQSLSYQEFLGLAREFIGRGNKRRLAVLLKGQIPEENEFSYTRARTWNAIRKASSYEYKGG